MEFFVWHFLYALELSLGYGASILQSSQYQKEESSSPRPPIPANLQERDTRSCRLRHCQANTGMLGLWRSCMEGGGQNRQYWK